MPNSTDLLKISTFLRVSRRKRMVDGFDAVQHCLDSSVSAFTTIVGRRVFSGRICAGYRFGRLLCSPWHLVVSYGLQGLV